MRSGCNGNRAVGEYSTPTDLIKRLKYTHATKISYMRIELLHATVGTATYVATAQCNNMDRMADIKCTSVPIDRYSHKDFLKNRRVK